MFIQNQNLCSNCYICLAEFILQAYVYAVGINIERFPNYRIGIDMVAKLQLSGNHNIKSYCKIISESFIVSHKLFVHCHISHSMSLC